MDMVKAYMIATAKESCQLFATPVILKEIVNRKY